LFGALAAWKSVRLGSARLSWPVSWTLPFSPFIYSPPPFLIPCHSLPLPSSLFSSFLSFSSLVWTNLSYLLVFSSFGTQNCAKLMGCRDMRKVKWGKRRRRQEGVERRMKKLQRLVPGGAGMNPDRLFLKTAEHILQLRIQLNVLQALSKVFNAWWWWYSLFTT